jgi:hypothetical protein
VPGISAAQGAAGRLGVSLTQARAPGPVRAHGVDGRLPADFDWASLADPLTTTVVYMGRRTIAELAETAIRHGLDPATPAIGIIQVTRPQQQIVSATIADIAARLDEAAPDGPVLIMFGRALAEVSGRASTNGGKTPLQSRPPLGAPATVGMSAYSRRARALLRWNLAVPGGVGPAKLSPAEGNASNARRQQPQVLSQQTQILSHAGAARPCGARRGAPIRHSEACRAPPSL